MSLTLIANSLVATAGFSGFGEAAPVHKEREWRTDQVGYDTWKEQRNQICTQPRRHWFINWELMNLAARDQLREIFDAARGRYNTFLWLDNDEYLATAALITTDGTENAYQLKCTYHGGESYSWDEDKKDIVPGATYPPVVTHSIDGAQTEVAATPGANEYVLDDTTGIMTWGVGTPPSAGVLSCTFEYYFRVRFAEDADIDMLIHTRLYQRTGLHLVEVIS